jgi:hypothetical protein
MNQFIFRFRYIMADEVVNVENFLILSFTVEGKKLDMLT